MNILTIQCEADLLDALPAYCQYFSLSYKFVPTKPKELPKSNSPMIVLVQNREPESLSLVRWIQQLRADVNYCNYPLIFLSEPLSEQAKILLDDIDLVFLAPLPFNASRFFQTIKDVAQFCGTSAKVLAARQTAAKALLAQDYLEASEQLPTLEKGLKHPLRYNLIAAETYVGMIDYRNAIKHVVQALSVNSKSIEARNLEASIFYKMGDMANYQKSVDSVQVIAELHLQNLLHWGDIFLDRGMVTKSLSSFEKALQADPTNQRAKFGVLASNLLQGKAKIDSAVEIDAIDLARAFNMRGIAMVQNGKFKIAEKLYCNAVQLIKDSGVVHKLWLNLGLCMKKKGDLVKALEYFERCDKSSPEGYARAKSQILQVRELLLSNKRPGLRSDNTSTIDALDYGSFKG